MSTTLVRCAALLGALLAVTPPAALAQSGAAPGNAKSPPASQATYSDDEVVKAANDFFSHRRHGTGPGAGSRC